MNFLKFIIVAFMLALAAMQGARAEESPTPVESGSFFDQMDGAVREVGRTAGRDLGNSLKKSGKDVAAGVTNTALSIAGALGLMYLLYEVMQFLSGKTKSMVQVLFDVGIPCMFAAAFITQYPLLLDKFDGLLEVFRTLGAKATGGASDPFNGILNVYTAAVGRISEAVNKAFSNVGEAFSFSTAMVNSPKFMVSLVDLLVTVFFALAILVLLLIGVAEVLGLLLIGPFLFAVGVAFGPLMIAGLVTPWTRDYFTKWVQFIVISAGLTGVINVIFTIAAALMETVGVGKNTDEPTAVGLVIMAILILTINSMISQAPSIASALFPGHVGVSKSTGGAVVTAGKNAMGGMKNGGKGVSASGKGVYGGGKNAYKFAKSRLSKKDATE